MTERDWIRLCTPWVDDTEIGAVANVLASGRLVQGPVGRRFEESVRDIVGVKHAIAMSSGTMSIWAVLQALGVGPYDEVIVPALTFPAAAECVLMVGAEPVFVDVSERTFNLDPDLLAASMTPRTRVVITVDQFGVPADYHAIEKIVSDGDAVLVEDAACALGSSLGGRPCGSFGRAAVLSFHPRKVITTGEGGMVLTDHDALALNVERLRNHGLDEGGCFLSAGLNLRMGEVDAAIGLAQLGKLGGIVRRRTELAGVYRAELGGLLRLQEAPEGSIVNFQTLAAVLPEAFDGAGRDRVIEEMGRRKIELRVASFSVPELAPYGLLVEDRTFPVAKRIHEGGVALPLHPAMSEGDVRVVCKALKDVLASAREGGSP